MTRDELKLLLPVMQAFAEGKEIQCNTGTGNVWRDVDNPAWYVGTRYRVKSEVVKVKGWAVVSIGTGCVLAVFSDEFDARQRRANTTDLNNWKIVELEGTYER